MANENKENITEAAREARRAYKRAWNKANADKVKAAQTRYWNRKAADKAEAYTQEERQEALENMQTAGKKGLHAARMNMAFSPSNYEYIQIMAGVQGKNHTQFVNSVIAQHMAEHKDLYQNAKLLLKEM